MLKKLVLVAGLLAAAGVAIVVVGRSARAPAAPSDARIDNLFAQWSRRDSPGCSVGISRNGQPVYERAYGMANLELDVANTPASAFEAASISKQFTAMSIMLLAERGRLSVDDEVRKYLPELPDYGSPLTIRHLLNHTSGLRDAFLLLELSVPEDEYSGRNDIILKQLARQRSLNYKPGTESQYNNGGYILLAIIVHRVSGQPLAAFADANIFKPLGMTGTRFQDDPAVLLPNRASNVDAVVYLGPEPDRDLSNRIELSQEERAEVGRRGAIKGDLRQLMQLRLGNRDRWFRSHPNDLPRDPREEPSR